MPSRYLEVAQHAGISEGVGLDPREIEKLCHTFVVRELELGKRGFVDNLVGDLGEVMLAEDGFDALAKISDYHPNIIFCDILMPRLDGYQTCAIIKRNEKFSSVPVVMLSSKDGLFDKARGRMVGSQDYLTKPFYIEELAAHHVPGRIKVAPEHTSDHVLRIMRKPTFELFYKFKEKFDRAAKKAGKEKMPVVPYFISSHPGSRPEDMAELALKTKDLGFRLEQVQDFTPTPMTVATEIYATGVHPYDSAEVCVARTPEEKAEQRSFFFWYKPEMKSALRKSMHRLGLGAIARRLLDEKKVTEDVTPPPHITPCGMKVPAGGKMMDGGPRGAGQRPQGGGCGPKPGKKFFENRRGR